MQDGDIITIDSDNNSLSVDLSDEEIARRLQAWQAPEPKYKKGVLAKYVKLVTSAAEGAITQ